MHTKMLAVAIATSLTFTSFGAFAQTNPGETQQLADLQAQLAALQTKVAQLEQTQAAQPAPAPAASDTAHRLDALEKLVDNTRLGGTMFVDFSNLDQTSNGKKTSASGTGLDVKRFYLSIDHKFNDVWSANLTTDFNYTSATGETQLFVKKAYVQGAFDKLATLRVGSANMPWIPFVEDWYGYRFVENTLVDRMHYGNSADWGLHLLGDNGVFNYQVSAINGGGYKNPSRSNHVDFAARVGVQPIKGLMFAVGGYDGDLGKDTATSPVLHSAKRYDAMAAWNRDGLRLGAEWFKADNWKNVLTRAGDSASGWSAWGSYDFARASIFARYDRVKPSEQLDPSLKDTYWNAGVAFPITKGIKVAVAYKDERLRNNGNVDVHSREVGAWGEVKF
ncbi:MAG: carbohydrate porin [Rhodanobacteraceae bacterium]|nr:MAG: carbohydrate porin [Rhodanobacteraceae bacterium]